VNPCEPWDVCASGADITANPSASSGAARATVSCCRALSEAFDRSAAAAGAASPPRWHACLASPAADAWASRRSSLEAGSEAVHAGISEALRVLQEAAAAAEAVRAAPAWESDSAREAVEAAANSGSRLLASLLRADLPAKLVACLESLCFEAQKDAMRLFTDLLRYALPLGTEACLVAYFLSRPVILECLLDGCGHPRVFAHCAQMLRSCSRQPQLITALLKGGAASRLLELTRSETFEISSEAFATLREILLAQSAISAPAVSADFGDFFAQFHLLLGADVDYVIRRQALRLLGDVLLDRGFREVMLAYIAEDRFLQIHMNAMRDSSRAIHLGAFHIFKVFVANPRKVYKVHSILHRNRSRLVKLLLVISDGRKGDTNLTEDLGAVIGLLEALEAPPMKRATS